MKNIHSLLAILLLSILTQCGSKDPAPASSITLTVDGTTKSVTPTPSLLRVETTTTNKGRTLGINAAEGSNLLILSISNQGFQNPPEDGLLVKTYYDPTSSKATCISSNGIVKYCDSGIVTYLVGTTFYSSAFYDNSLYESTIKVTSNDVVSKRISGEFDVKVQAGSNEVLTLKGKFENISYTKQSN
jgi:predicted small lipoprotein YifL